MNNRDMENIGKRFVIGGTIVMIVMTLSSVLSLYVNKDGMKKKEYTPSTWNVSTPEPVEVVAESFAVDDMGTLIFRNGDETERAFACGNWTEVKCLSR